MYKMSKKSLFGRIMMLPIFDPVVVIEFVLDKCFDWSRSVHKLRIRLQIFADDKFPLDCQKKTNL